jgi:hypothetical protein
MSNSNPPAESPKRRGSLSWLDPLALILAVFLGALTGLRWLSGGEGVLTVEDDEVAVLHDGWSGRARQVDTPGKRLILPFLQEARVIKRSPAELVFSGTERANALLVPELAIRASDGSSLRFEGFRVQFSLLPDQAERCLEDTSAQLEAAAALVEGYTRAILRDEYGRFSTSEVVLHESLKAAGAASRARLESVLAEHGLQVLDLSTPKPRFDPAHELAVERRKVADQEVERLKTQFLQLEAERDEALARLEMEKEQELAKLELALGEYRAEAAKSDATQRAAATQYLEERRSAGETRRFEQEQEALALTERYTVAAAALQERVDQLAEGGEAAVRASWIERLREVPFQVVPYTRDRSPQSVELAQAALLASQKN